jgi:hypothetical protein
MKKQLNKANIKEVRSFFGLASLMNQGNRLSSGTLIMKNPDIPIPHKKSSESEDFYSIQNKKDFKTVQKHLSKNNLIFNENIFFGFISTKL